MNLLQQFVDFLTNQKNKPSLSTIKNYKADIGQFIRWLEEQFQPSFDPTKITQETLEQYKKVRNLSASSMERHTSSLRKFFHFLNLKGITSLTPFEKKIPSGKIKALEDPWMIRNFKSFLYEYKKSNLTIKNYVNDVKRFFVWLKEVSLVKYSWNIADRNLLNKINFLVIGEYKQRLIKAKFSPATINRKLSSLRNYMSWAKKQGLISSRHPEFISGSPPTRVSLRSNEMLKPVQHDTEKNTYSSFPPIRLAQKSLKGIYFLFDNLFILPLAEIINNGQYLFWKFSGKKIFYASPDQDNNVRNIQKEFYAPLNVSVRYLPAHKKIWHYLRFVRPNWYKKYHSYSFTHYLHFAILTILSCTIGFGMYNRFLANTPKENSILGVSVNGSPRILSFQGKLTDSFEIPITKESEVLFSLYDNENTPLDVSLWQETNSVKPDSNGDFSIILGKKTPLPNAVFSQSSRLFLGVSVGGNDLKPRQELATVSLAESARALQGLEPITNTSKTANVVLALDSSGNLSIAGDKSHTFQAIGGNLVLSGKVLSLTTVPGSNSDIEIVPDGIGQIDLSKPIHNSTNNNNLISAAGSVEFDDTVAILATTSAQPALFINQNSIGPLISASTSGIAKFAVDNDGTGIFAGDLEINGGDLRSSSTLFNIGSPDGTTIVKSNLSINKDLTLASLTTNGGILYTNESGKIQQISAGSSSDCLTGGTNPSFISCSKIFNQAGNIGIGTTSPLLRLDVWDSQSATAAAQIYNTDTGTDADGLVLKLGNTSISSVATTNRFLSFETAGIGTVGSIRGNGGTGVTYVTSGIADFAEYFKKDHNQSIEYGSLICLDNNGLAVKCGSSASSGQDTIIGVASERPAFLGGENLGDNSVAVGLIGQVETFAAALNGEIKAGDMLTASDIPGVTVKATKVGQVVGKALEDLNPTDETKIAGYYDPDNKEYRDKDNFPNIPKKPNIITIVKINALVNVSWYDPAAFLAQNGDLEIVSSNKYQVLGIENKSPNNSPILNTYYLIHNTSKELIKQAGAFTELVTANLRAGLIEASEIVVQDLIVTSDSIIVNGQNLKDYIAQIANEVRIKNNELNIISPVAKIEQLATNIISPLASDSNISISLFDSQFTIHDSNNASGSAVAKIDNQGNASFNGQLSASSGQFEDASISGILKADKIIADNIEGLEKQDFSFLTSQLSSNYINLASYSAQLSSVPDLIADRVQINQGLMVFGSASLSDLAVAGHLSIGGTMFITENSIEALGSDLSLQSLRQGGLSIMAGLVYIDTKGNVKIQGDLSVTGKLAVGSDVIASGSGTFTKLNFSFIQPVLAVSATEAIASSSAGIANIAPYQSEITIKNNLVTDKSVIYITPVGTPSAQTPFLMRQVSDGTWLRQKSPESNSSQIGSFTVGVQSPTNHSIDFNWLIVN